MSGITNINGTNYNIASGKTMVDGTIYVITKGKTLIDGTSHNITFDAGKLLKITLTGDTGSIDRNYITVNNTKYYQPTTLYFPSGIQINCKSSMVRLNGKYQGTSYLYTLSNKNITINFNGIFGNLIPAIDINEGA